MKRGLKTKYEFTGVVPSGSVKYHPTSLQQKGIHLGCETRINRKALYLVSLVGGGNLCSQYDGSFVSLVQHANLNQFKTVILGA